MNSLSNGRRLFTRFFLVVGYSPLLLELLSLSNAGFLAEGGELVHLNFKLLVA